MVLPLARGSLYDLQAIWIGHYFWWRLYFLRSLLRFIFYVLGRPFVCVCGSWNWMTEHSTQKAKNALVLPFFFLFSVACFSHKIFLLNSTIIKNEMQDCSHAHRLDWTQASCTAHMYRVALNQNSERARVREEKNKKLCNAVNLFHASSHFWFD